MPPIEYLRHATLDMNNFKSSLIADAAIIQAAKLNSAATVPTKETTSGQTNTADQQGLHANEISGGGVGSGASSSATNRNQHRSVQDLIVRYKEVSSWIKRLIQSQPSTDKRTAIILSAIRCAITCWNIGNFNSSREIWLGLKCVKYIYIILTNLGYEKKIGGKFFKNFF